MTRLALRPALLALAAAIALGVAGRVALHASPALPYGGAIGAAGHAVVALGAPWLVVAWAVGALCRGRWAGAAAGGAALALGTVGWYSLTVAAAGPAALPYAWPVAPAWAVVALCAGAAFGFAGALWRSGRGVLAAVPAGALAGEAWLLAGEWTGRAAQAVLALELLTGATIVLALARRRPAALAVGLAVAFAVALGEDAVRDALRLAGWAGP